MPSRSKKLRRFYELSAEQGSASSELRLGDYAYYGASAVKGMDLHLRGMNLQSSRTGIGSVDVIQSFSKSKNAECIINKCIYLYLRTNSSERQESMKMRLGLVMMAITSIPLGSQKDPSNIR